MLRNGLATVYETKFGSEFGRYEKYRKAEHRAKERSVGMWAKPGLLERWLKGKGGGEVETPRAFKGMQSVEKEKEEKDGGGKK